MILPKQTTSTQAVQVLKAVEGEWDVYLGGGSGFGGGVEYINL